MSEFLSLLTQSLMMKQMYSRILVFNTTLTEQIAQKDFITLMSQGKFKIYKRLILIEAFIITLNFQNIFFFLPLPKIRLIHSRSNLQLFMVLLY